MGLGCSVNHPIYNLFLHSIPREPDAGSARARLQVVLKCGLLVVAVKRAPGQLVGPVVGQACRVQLLQLRAPPRAGLAAKVWRAGGERQGSGLGSIGQVQLLQLRAPPQTGLAAKV